MHCKWPVLRRCLFLFVSGPEILEILKALSPEVVEMVILSERYRRGPVLLGL